jgi:hypothetical protein
MNNFGELLSGFILGLLEVAEKEEKILWYFSCMVLVVEIMGCLGRLLSLRGFHV